MPTIHALLDDTQKQCQTLVEEMKTFKSARIINQRATDGLEATCKALQETTRAIQPFTEARVRRLFILVASAALLNSILFIAMLLVVIFSK